MRYLAFMRRTISVAMESPSPNLLAPFVFLVFCLVKFLEDLRFAGMDAYARVLNVGRRGPSFARSVSSTCLPAGVNLMALFRRFISTCDRRKRSPLTIRPVGIVVPSTSSTPFSARSRRCRDNIPRYIHKSITVLSIFSLPASIIARSVRSAIRRPS